MSDNETPDPMSRSERNNQPSKSFNRKILWKRIRPQVSSALFAHSLTTVQRPSPQDTQKVSQDGELKSKLTRNRRLAYIIALTHYVGFLTPIWVIFGTDYLGFSLTLSLILGSAGWVSSAFFEIPLGAFADKYGRKFAVSLGLGLCAVADLALVVFPQFLGRSSILLFVVLLIFQIFAGAGFSLRSGSLEGLLHDTYEAANERTQYSKLSGQMLFLLNVSRVLTVPIGAWLYSLDKNPESIVKTFPYMANVTSYVIALVAASMLFELRSQTQEEVSNKSQSKIMGWLVGQVGETISEMRANTDVVRIVVILGLYAVIGEGNWALYQQYFRDHGIDVGASSWIYTVLVIVMAVGSRFVPFIYRRINVMWALIIITALVAFNILLMRLPIQFAVFAFVVNALVAPMTLYLHDNAIQNRMTGNHKVTALSVASVAYTIGSTIGVFGVGAIADQIGVVNAQWIFIGYGFVAVVIMALWCRNENFEVLYEDRIATIGEDLDDGEQVAFETPPREKPKSIPGHPNDPNY